MKWSNYFTIAFSIFFISNEKFKSNFSVSIENYIEVPGYTYTYLIDTDSLKIKFHCDRGGCKDTVVYKSKLSPEQSERYYIFLKYLHLVELESVYEKSGADGQSINVTISGDSIISKTVLTIRYHHPVIKQLIDKTNLLIMDANRKIYYGR